MEAWRQWGIFIKKKKKKKIPLLDLVEKYSLLHMVNNSQLIQPGIISFFSVCANFNGYLKKIS